MALEGARIRPSEREGKKGGGVKKHITQVKRRGKGPHLQTLSSARAGG